MQLPGTPRYGGSSQTFGLVRCEVVIEQFLEMGQNVLVGFLAGDELAVVETGAVIQEQFDTAKITFFLIIPANP